MKKFHIIFTIAPLFLIPKTAFCKGWLDVSTTYNRYIGWACQPGSADPVGIHIYADGHYIGGGNAAIVREFAVQYACNSITSRHGFDISIDVPAILLDGTIRDVTVYAIYANNRSERLSNTPAKLKFFALPGKEKPTVIGDVVGRDLGSQEVGPLGHIGIWDGRNVLEAIGYGDANDTIKETPWSSFSSKPNLWKTISPVWQGDFRQRFCDESVCWHRQNDNGVLYLLGNQTRTTWLQEMAARSAYVKYKIGASYTLSAYFTPARQGLSYWTKSFCSPFASQCQMTKVERKPIRGFYRCDGLVLDAWTSTAIRGGTPLLGQEIYAAPHQSVVDSWNRQMSYQIAWNRIITPANVHANLQQRNW